MILQLQFIFLFIITLKVHQYTEQFKRQFFLLFSSNLMVINSGNLNTFDGKLFSF